MNQETQKRVVKVVVLGDIGRSPRMQYHAISLAQNNVNVNIIGYLDTKPLTEIVENKNITITKLYPFAYENFPRMMHYVLKTIWQSISLFLTLLTTGKCDFLLCQNPPAIPTLPICRFYCLVTRTKFIIDWHNYAYTIMGLSMSAKHPLLKVATAIERYFGQSSMNNFCVTYAMRNDLLQNWDIRAKVLYDKPPKIFKSLTLQEKHDWFVKISQQYPEFAAPGKDKLNLPSGDSEMEKTAFTVSAGGKVEEKLDRPGLIFSSTSWTPDEDFGILFKALEAYETAYNANKHLPKLLCVITGKGPLKSHYIEQINLKKWQHVKVVTPWLEAADYPKMVASADLGVCLHTSSSGLDLPMKIVDMFGAGLPVCAYDFKCLSELVNNGENGYIFKDSEELSGRIIEWFQDFPKNSEQNNISDKMKTNLKTFQEIRWEDNWNLRAKKYFEM